MVSIIQYGISPKHGKWNKNNHYKGFSSKSEVTKYDNTFEEGWKEQQARYCEYNNKGKYSGPNNKPYNNIAFNKL